MRGRILMLVTCLLSQASVRADILVVRNAGNTIIPRAESDISMDAETVKIEPRWVTIMDTEHLDGYKVSCEFVLTSHATEAITREIAFPISDQAYEHWFAKGFLGSVESNGRRTPLKTKIKMVAESPGARSPDATRWEQAHSDVNYPGYVIWQQTFAPGETQTVRCEYPMGQARGMDPRHPFKGIVLEYVVRTGALWKGKIGRATITIHLAPSRFDHDRITMTYPDSVRWKDASKNTLTWHFTDWQPTEDIAIAFTRWTDYGVNDVAWNGYSLPHPYLGSQEAYTERYLDRLVDREIRRVAEFYPQRARSVDRVFLRSMIAEFLFYELFARQGDPFILGPATETNVQKYMPVLIGWNDTFMFSLWHGYFQGYSYRGGWYDWFDDEKDKPRPAVALDTLSPQAQQNAAFLRNFIKRPLLR